MLQNIMTFCQNEWRTLLSGIGVVFIVGAIKFLFFRKKPETQQQVKDSNVHGSVIQGNHNTINEKDKDEL